MKPGKEFTEMTSRSVSSNMLYRPMRRIYVFQVPTRIFHWINVVSLMSLIVTGYIIGNPPALLQESEASQNYWFGINRFIHFGSAWIFTVNWIFRVFWAFIGANKWENWRNFLPLSKKQWKEAWEIIKLDVLMIKNDTHLSIGHNALAGFSYFIIFIVSLVMVFTGFALYAPMSESWFPQLFNWVIPLLGGDMFVRFIHHASMWIFIVFTIIHVHLVMYHDYVEGRGELSSIIGGWKFIEEDILENKNKSEEQNTENEDK
ncbi:MAG: Ni/Fe-hydrogenase, b-type cytochrome subunit [Cyclobacteriaceae bacterium]|nr:Ni/Fe-hydrogenase, b-type cytochrome subunit [Cyclobacteriaceae bacterium]